MFSYFILIFPLIIVIKILYNNHKAKYIFVAINDINTKIYDRIDIYANRIITIEDLCSYLNRNVSDYTFFKKINQNEFIFDNVIKEKSVYIILNKCLYFDEKGKMSLIPDSYSEIFIKN